jgi:SAM-dependent methyltransferase
VNEPDGDAPSPSLRVTARSIYGSDAQGYAAGRPEYPERVYESLQHRCGLRAGSDVLEIGAGTGRVTHRLVGSGARVVAVEPDRQMADHLVGALGEGVNLVIGTFEEADLGENRFDLVVAATSFHWVDQSVGLPKLGRILRSGGWAALWWTIFDDPETEDAFREALRVRLGREDFDGQRKVGYQLDATGRYRDLHEVAGLEAVGSEVIRWTVEMTSSQLRALYGSLIAVRRLPPDQQQQMLDEVSMLADEGFGGRVERPFVTVMYTGRRP